MYVSEDPLLGGHLVVGQSVIVKSGGSTWRKYPKLAGVENYLVSEIPAGALFHERESLDRHGYVVASEYVTLDGGKEPQPLKIEHHYPPPLSKQLERSSEDEASFRRWRRMLRLACAGDPGWAWAI
jgi:hypothetical protein